MAPKKRTHASTKRTAADMIAATLKRGATSALPPPPPEALEELRKLLKHNDAAPWGQRVSSASAIEMLQSYGWVGKSLCALDNLCAKRFGRRSYGHA